jgi:UDP-2,4-diacetamido-2,4,6-trideoxy-beta-L-altropyranose hydrolase
MWLDAGPGAGLGHLSRCQALAVALEECGWTVEMEIEAGGEALNLDFVRAVSASVNTAVGHWHEDAQRVSRLAAEASIAVFDSYVPDELFYRQVSESQVPLLVFFDDENSITYPRGIVINAAPYADARPYPLLPGVEYFLGTKWTVLRKEFWDAEPIRVQESPQSILLMLGADDIHCFLPRLHVLVGDRLPGLSQVIACAGFNRSLLELERTVQAPHRLLVDPSPEVLVQAMRDSDLAVSAAGQSALELACIGVPSVLLQVAENQSANMDGWERLGLMQKERRWDEEDVLPQIVQDVNALTEYGNRTQWHALAISAIDGGGARRIARLLDERTGGKK